MAADRLPELAAIVVPWRGEDHLSNTPRQLLLLRALGLREPRYGHLALIVGEDGAPLSKRHGAMSLGELREQGYLAAALNNYLARLGHSYTDDSLLDMAGLAAGFDPARPRRAGSASSISASCSVLPPCDRTNGSVWSSP